jgi:hypothetical protein
MIYFDVFLNELFLIDLTKIEKDMQNHMASWMKNGFIQKFDTDTVVINSMSNSYFYLAAVTKT